MSPARWTNHEQRVDPRLSEACIGLEALRLITIAAIEGFSVGGGVPLVLAYNFRVIAE